MYAPRERNRELNPFLMHNEYSVEVSQRGRFPTVHTIPNCHSVINPRFTDKGDVNCTSSTRFMAASLCKDWRGTITVILHNMFAYLLQICIEKGLWMSELAYLQKVHKSSVWGITFQCISSTNHSKLWCWMESTLWEV